MPECEMQRGPAPPVETFRSTFPRCHQRSNIRNQHERCAHVDIDVSTATRLPNPGAIGIRSVVGQVLAALLVRWLSDPLLLWPDRTHVETPRQRRSGRLGERHGVHGPQDL